MLKPSGYGVWRGPMVSPKGPLPTVSANCPDFANCPDERLSPQAFNPMVEHRSGFFESKIQLKFDVRASRRGRFSTRKCPGRVVWRSVVVGVMKSEECRERASHCLHLADTARSDQSRSTFNSLAQHWLRLAEELEDDQLPVERPPATRRSRSPKIGHGAENPKMRFRRSSLRKASCCWDDVAGRQGRLDMSWLG